MKDGYRTCAPRLESLQAVPRAILLAAPLAVPLAAPLAVPLAAPLSAPLAPSACLASCFLPRTSSCHMASCFLPRTPICLMVPWLPPILPSCLMASCSTSPKTSGFADAMNVRRLPDNMAAAIRRSVSVISLADSGSSLSFFATSFRK